MYIGKDAVIRADQSISRDSSARCWGLYAIGQLDYAINQFQQAKNAIQSLLQHPDNADALAIEDPADDVDTVLWTPEKARQELGGES